MNGPLHEQIRVSIERQILSGQLHPGARLPSELDMMQRYDCARMTVNRAMSQLAQAGLIVRRKRAGSFVSQPQSQSAVLSIPDVRTEVQARGGAYRFELLDRATLIVRSGSQLNTSLPGAKHVLRLRCQHFSDRRVFAIEERDINIEAVPAALEADFNTEAPGSWLLKHVPWTAATHVISACAATRKVATRLGIRLSAACLVIRRRTFRSELGITHVTLTYPADLFQVVATFGPPVSGAEKT